MALIRCKFKSQALQTTTDVRVFLPTDLAIRAGMPVEGVITLLHGITNDGDDWINNSCVLRYAAVNGLALVIPDADNSFYNDMVYGSRYFTWLTEELPALLAQTFRLPQDREKNAVCGLSMGGYGAMLLALTHPERYAYCGSFSGGVDLASAMQGAKDSNPLARQLFAPIFGDQFELPENRDLFRLAEKVSKLPAEQRPQLLCTVGKQDHEPYYIYEQNQNLRALMKTLPLDYTYMEWQGGHEWEFWDRSIAAAIDRFFHPGFMKKRTEDWTTPITMEENHHA